MCVLSSSSNLIVNFRVSFQKTFLYFHNQANNLLNWKPIKSSDFFLNLITRVISNITTYREEPYVHIRFRLKNSWNHLSIIIVYKSNILTDNISITTSSLFNILEWLWCHSQEPERVRTRGWATRTDRDGDDISGGKLQKCKEKSPVCLLTAKLRWLFLCQVIWNWKVYGSLNV